MGYLPETALRIDFLHEHPKKKKARRTRRKTKEKKRKNMKDNERK